MTSPFPLNTPPLPLSPFPPFPPTVSRQFVETPTNLVFDRAATCQAPDQTTYVFGGVDGTGREHNTLWQLSSNGHSATVLSAASTLPSRPAARKLANMAYLVNCTGPRPCLMVYGGDTAGVRRSDAWVFYFDTGLWEQPTGLNSASRPSARTASAISASADNTRAYVFGGNTASGATNDVFALAPGGFSDAVPSEMTNLARGKWTAQSSADPVWGTRGSNAGVDGVITTNFAGTQNGNPSSCNCNWCSHGSGADADPWWVVDLGSVQQVDFLHIYTRSDCCLERNMNFRIYTGNANSTQQWRGAGVSVLSGPNIPVDLRAGGPNIINVAGLRARFIWFVLPGNGRVLSMCEFQAFQKNPWIWRRLSGTYNAALLKSATQSSTLSGWGDGLAFRAVDGITTNNLNYQPYTCAHTTNAAPAGSAEWWMVDLGKTHDVNSLSVWGRNDCCTGRNFNIRWYVGNSRDWRYNTLCANSPADITPPSGGGSRTFTCPARGRYVLAVKPVTTQWADANIIQLCEVQVTANRLLDQPPARAGMATANYGGTLVIFGGADSSGFRYNDIRMWDMERNMWLPAVAPLGTPPVSRAYASFYLLPNASLGWSIPSNSFGLFGGLSNTDQLNDFMTLTLPQCPPYERVGIINEDCRHGGTACYFTCDAFTVNMNGANPLVCQADGTWRGVTPPCTPRPPTQPNIVSATVTGTSASLTWTAPTTSYWPVTSYRASSLVNDVVDSFPNNAFPDATKWTLMPTYVGPCGTPSTALSCTFYRTQTANGIDFRDGMLRLNADLGKNVVRVNGDAGARGPGPQFLLVNSSRVVRPNLP